MEVIILAGGLGTRLRSEVKDVPKCMAPVAGKPFLWYLLSDLKKYNDVNRVILSVGYLREVIFEWIPTIQNEFPFSFDYSVEEEPLGTGGGIRLAMEKVTEDEVIILNGDTYFAVDLDLLLKQHRDNGMKLTLALKPMTNFDRYGQVLTFGDLMKHATENLNLEDNNITEFKEKQPCAEGAINGGVYVMSKINDFMNNLPSKFSFEKEVLEKNVPNKLIGGFKHNRYFIDIGIPEDYHKANMEFPELFNK